MLNAVLARSGVAAAAAAGWVLVGYPLSLVAARPRPARRDAGTTPTVTAVVCAAGDPAALERKLRALRQDGYPRDLLRLVVAADGPVDLVHAVRRAWPGAVVLHCEQRRGKAAALAAALPHATGDVVLLTDADNVLAPGAVSAATRWFADPQVWAVAGRRGESGSAYDVYEDLLRRLESRSGSVAAASGEFLAVRRTRLRPVPPGTVNDDLWLLIDVLARGGRVVYEPAAGGTEAPLGARAEIERRARIAAGRAQLARDLRRLPARDAWRVGNHKFGRLAVPPLAALALIGLPAARHPLARVLATGELLALGLGFGELVGRRAPGRLGRRASAACGQALTGAIAGFAGLGRAALRRQPATWKAVR